MKKYFCVILNLMLDENVDMYTYSRFINKIFLGLANVVQLTSEKKRINVFNITIMSIYIM